MQAAPLAAVEPHCWVLSAEVGMQLPLLQQPAQLFALQLPPSMLWQVPCKQVCVAELQVAQARPRLPQALATLPMTQRPLVSQHPEEQFAGVQFAPQPAANTATATTAVGTRKFTSFTCEGPSFELFRHPMGSRGELSFVASAAARWATPWRSPTAVLHATRGRARASRMLGA
jgi:hypothetical protein